MLIEKFAFILKTKNNYQIENNKYMLQSVKNIKITIKYKLRKSYATRLKPFKYKTHIKMNRLKPYQSILL